MKQYLKLKRRVKILKRKTFLQIFALMGVFVLCSGVIAFGSSLTTEIKAILSREVTIKYEGEVQNMKDGLGNPVLPSDVQWHYLSSHPCSEQHAEYTYRMGGCH